MRILALLSTITILLSTIPPVHAQRGTVATEGSPIYKLQDHYDFTGGLNTSLSAHQIDENESPFCENSVLNDSYVLTVRPGYRHQHKFPIGGFDLPVFGLHRFYKYATIDDVEREILVACGGALWRYDEGARAYIKIKDGLTTTVDHPWHFTTYTNRVFCYNGYDPIYVWDGENCYECGIDPPETTMSAADSASSGDVSPGTYRYKYTFYDPGTAAESGPSGYVEHTIADPKTAIDLSGISYSDAPTDRGVNMKAKIFRTEASGGTYYYVTTLESGVATYTDITSDAELSYEVITKSNNKPPPFTDMCVYKGQLIGIGDPDNPSQARFSGLITNKGPENWPPLALVNVDSNDGSKLERVMVLGDNLIVWKTTKMFRFVGGAWTETVLPAIRPVRSSLGTPAPWSLVNANGVAIYMSRMGSDLGVFMYDNNLVKLVSQKITPEFDNIPPSAVKSACASYSDGKYRISVRDTRERGIYNNKVYEYDVASDSWWPLTRLYVNCWSNWIGDRDRGELYFGASDGAYVNRYGSVARDPGFATIPFLYRTKNYSSESPQTHKRLRYVYLDFSKGWNDSLTMVLIIDYGKEEYRQKVDLSDLISAEWAEFDPSTEWADDAIKDPVTGDIMRYETVREGFYWAAKGELQHRVLSLHKGAVSRYFALQWEEL